MLILLKHGKLTFCMVLVLTENIFVNKVTSFWDSSCW